MLYFLKASAFLAEGGTQLPEHSLGCSSLTASSEPVCTLPCLVVLICFVHKSEAPYLVTDRGTN